MGQTVTAAVVNLYNSSNLPSWTHIFSSAVGSKIEQQFTFDPTQYTEILVLYQCTTSIHINTSVYPISMVTIGNVLRTECVINMATNEISYAMFRYAGNNIAEMWIGGAVDSAAANRAVLYAR